MEHKVPFFEVEEVSVLWFLSSCSQHASFCTVQSVTGVYSPPIRNSDNDAKSKQLLVGIHLTFRPLTLHHNPPNGIAQCQVYALPARPLTPHVSQACIVIRIASFLSFRTRTNLTLYMQMMRQKIFKF